MCILLLYLKQDKRFCSSSDNLLNLTRISNASIVNVKYDRLAFRGVTLLILSTMNDLF